MLTANPGKGINAVKGLKIYAVVKKEKKNIGKHGVQTLFLSLIKNKCIELGDGYPKQG